MARKYLAVAIENETANRSALRIEKAAENVSTGLDKIIHERMRLGIISALAANVAGAEPRAVPPTGDVPNDVLDEVLERFLGTCGNDSIAVAAISIHT